MRNRETDVGTGHRLEARPAATVTLPRVGQRQTERAEPFSTDGGEQCLLVREVTIERRARDAEPLANGPERELVHALRLDRAHGFGDQRPAEVAVMVLPGRLPAARRRP